MAVVDSGAYEFSGWTYVLLERHAPEVARPLNGNAIPVVRYLDEQRDCPRSMRCWSGINREHRGVARAFEARPELLFPDADVVVAAKEVPYQAYRKRCLRERITDVAAVVDREGERRLRLVELVHTNGCDETVYDARVENRRKLEQAAGFYKREFGAVPECMIGWVYLGEPPKMTDRGPVFDVKSAERIQRVVRRPLQVVPIGEIQERHAAVA